MLSRLLSVLVMSAILPISAVFADGDGIDYLPVIDCEGKVCAIYPSGGDVEQTRCKEGNGWRYSGSCTPRNAKKGHCFKQKNKAGKEVGSCSAEICNEDSALWLHKKGSGYQSYGLCRKKDWLQKTFCDKSDGCRDCNGSKCVLKIVEWNQYGKTDAYHDDELCVCESQTTSPEPQPQPQPQPKPEDKPTEQCFYTYSGTIRCANGNTYTVNKQIDVSDLVSECPEPAQRQQKFNELFQKDTNKMFQLQQKLCQQMVVVVNNIPTGPSAAEIEAAKSVLASFFTTTQDKASVWRTEEGKFNTARLASDLTAGVVLGTVGGVVSGVVIKKKQVQKGFEALYCSVGGQKMAEWGDEFDINLRR